MARKRPPGARKRQPTPRQPGGSSSALERIMGSLVLAYLPEQHAPAAVLALREMIESSTFDPPLPEHYSLFILDSGDDDSLPVALAAFGLDDQAEMLMGWLERHERVHEWQLWVPDEPETVRVPGVEA